MISFNDLDQAKITAHEETLAALLEDGYGLDASMGTVNRELVVRPNAALAVYLGGVFEEFFNNMTLKTAAEQADPDDSLVEALASNFRLERLTGSTATGTVAVFTRQTNNVYLSDGVTFSTGGVTLYVSRTYVGIYDREGEGTADIEYRRMIKFDDDTYVFTVPVFTLDNISETLGAGQSLTMSPDNSQVLKAEISSAVVGGSADETTAALVRRAASGVTARVPSGRAHMAALISRDLNLEVDSIKAFGMGDVEVTRDKNNMAVTSMGGRCDVVCRTSKLLSETIVAKTGSHMGGSRWSVTVDAADAPGFYYISRISNSTGAIGLLGDSGVSYSWLASSDWDVNPPDLPTALDARFSPYQAARVEFDFEGVVPDSDGKAPFSVYLTGLPNLKSIQDYMNSEDVANPAQDVLVKAPVPAVTTVSLKVSHAPGLVDVTADDLSLAVASAINDLPVGRGYLTANDVVKAVLAVDSDLVVEFPVSFETLTVTKTGFSTRRSANGRLDAIEDSSEAVTKNNTAFFCGSGDVSVEMVERL